jgi:serine phosphatase RsbU (regulator of sigma subunit)
MIGTVDYPAVLRAGQGADPSSVVDLVARAARDLGGSDVVTYLVDYEQQVLEPLPDRSAHADLPETEAVAGSMAGRSFLTHAPVTAERPDGTRVWVPIVEGSDRTGVIALTLHDVDDDVVARCEDIGRLAGYLIATHSRSSDLYQLHRRRKSMSLAASMQWDLLPPLVLKTSRCSVAGRLEPAYQVGGDCFDYAHNGPVLDLALIDAMGHGVSASSIASLVVGAYRHGRREGRGLAALHAELNDVVAQQFMGECFATGQLARLDLASGVLSWTNAGHHCPLLLRNGRVIGQLECEPMLPWGLDDAEPVVEQDQLEPGDGILFFTDGVTEARTPDGTEFGLDRLADVVGQCASNQLAPEDVVRFLVRSVLEHRASALRDDATVVLLEWHGPPV